MSTGTKLALQETVQSYRNDDKKNKFSKEKKPKKLKSENSYLGDVTGWQPYNEHLNTTEHTFNDHPDLIDELFG